MNKKIINNTVKKQKGSTLITALVFLVLMTGLTFAATRASIFDTKISNNNQELMLLYQEIENDLKLLSTVEQLHDPLAGQKFDSLTNLYKVPTLEVDSFSDKQITEMGEYHCNGFEGKATTQGSSARDCWLYDFQVKGIRKGNGASGRHNRGSGKEVPRSNPSKYSAL